MPASLNIRDIGGARKTAIEDEARRRGVAVADIVRQFLDEGLARARAERERAAWIAAAKPGLQDEARHLEAHGPTLARFRRPGSGGR